MEITGPVDRKMVINALNSGARGFMADFEDSLSPTWANVVEGQVNLTDAIEGTIEFTGDDGREYKLGDEVATLLVRPRGWHLVEKHVRVDGEPVAGAFVDAGLYLHAQRPAAAREGLGPVLLPAQDGVAPRGAAVGRGLRLRRGRARARPRDGQDDRAHRDAARRLRDGGDPLRAARALVLAERRALGLHLLDHQDLPRAAGVRPARPQRREDDRAVHEGLQRAAGQDLPPARRARDGRHGRADPLAQGPRGQRARDRGGGGRQGARGRRRASTAPGSRTPTSCETAMAEFDKVLGDRPNQVDRQRDDVDVGAAELLDVASTPGAITEAGLRNNVNVGIQYISSWLRGNGAAGIYGLMEDAATAEISRSQVWQWIRHGRTLEDDGTPITRRARPPAGGRGARAHPHRRSATTSGSSARAARRSRGRCSSRSRWPTSSPSSSPSRPTSSSTERVGALARRHRRGPRDRPRDRRATAGRRRCGGGDRARPGRAGVAGRARRARARWWATRATRR